jgi:hypothetical protein
MRMTLMCFGCAPSRPFYDASAHPSVNRFTRFRPKTNSKAWSGWHVISGRTGIFGMRELRVLRLSPAPAGIDRCPMRTTCAASRSLLANRTGSLPPSLLFDKLTMFFAV